VTQASAPQTLSDPILRPGSVGAVFLAELRPTPGRMQSALRTTVAMTCGVLLSALVSEPGFAITPLAAMTETSPGTVHSPELLVRRVLASFLCALAGIVVVASVPQMQVALYLGVLLLIWCVIYLARVLPVGSSGLRVALWTLGPLVSGPLHNPQDFEQVSLLSALGVSSGVVIGYAASVLVFPGQESARARVAVDALLRDSSARLRQLVQDCRMGRAPQADPQSTTKSTLTELAALAEAIRTYVEPGASFPELAPLSRIACISDSAAVHLKALVQQAGAAAPPREAAARIAERTADLFDRLRGLSFERHWARPGDMVPELDALVRESEGLIDEGDSIIRGGSGTVDDLTLSMAGLARRLGGSIRMSLTDRPLARSDGATALSLPMGFDPAGPTGRAPTLTAALARFDTAAATSAAAAVCGMGLALLVSAFFLPMETTAASMGAAFVLQSTLGGSGRRGTLRLLGTVIGGMQTLVALALFTGGLQTLAWYLAIMGTLSFLSAWVLVGSPRTNYSGLMMASAWATAILVDPQPPVSVVPALERIGSVLLTGICVSIMIWLFATTTARVAVMRSIATGWRGLAELVRAAAMKPVEPGELESFRRLSHRLTANLATTADMREAYAFERRMVQTAFMPVLATMAEQQRTLLLTRAMAVGRFLDHGLPATATAALEAATETQARRLEALAMAFERPAAAEPEGARLPSPAETRAAAEAARCSAEDVARLLLRRDAIGMLQSTIDRAERIQREGFVWIDGRLESVLERDAIEAEASRRAAMLAAAS
jgi:multidrug resistance protein MdtO